MPEQKIHPMIASELRKLQKQIKALDAENERLSIELQDEQKAREAMQRQEVHIDDMPGKQLPFKYQINIDLPGGSQAPVTGTVNVSRDGPFIARRLFVSCVVTDAPVLDDGLTVEDYSHMIGRFVPITSNGAWTYNNWAIDIASFNPATYVPPPIDFEWSYNDGGSERNRQDKPISGDILARHDDDGFLMNNEIFAAGTTISFVCHLLRTVPILAHTNDPDITGALDLQLKVIFDGFKVLQPLEM